MTGFPMSTKLKEALTSAQALKSHYALRLACQQHFEKWLQFSSEEHAQRSNYLGFRCLLEALDECNMKKTRRRAMRKSQMESFQDFVDNVTDRFDFEEKDREVVHGQVHKLYLEHQPDFVTLELVTGLQAFLQKLLEYVVLFDRKSYLSENGLCCEIVSLFDPLISPRCYGIFCQKANVPNVINQESS